MRVLLVSPLDPDVPKKLKFLMGGENTYTRTLLKHSPKGVKYTHWQDALKKGQIEYTGWQSPLRYLIKVRILPTSSGIQCFRLKKKFDLIHAHAYNLKLEGNIHPPVVLSDSSANFLFLRDYAEWVALRVNLTYVLKKILVKTLKIYDQELNLREARLVVWSRFAKNIHTDLGQNPKRITVIPPGLPLIKLPKPHTLKPKPFSILFIGTWFERKGGKILLEAYKNLRKKYPYIRLTIVGQIPKSLRIPKEIRHKDYVSRETLLNKYLPQADVLVLIPPKAEGYGLVVLEAASRGIPSIVTTIYALPELVDDGKTGYVIKPGDPRVIEKAIEKLIKNKRLRDRMGEASLKKFKDKFWIDKTNKKLLKVYGEALNR